MNRRYTSGREIIESGKATILELATYCDSGELQAFGPAGERVVNDTDCTLSPKTLDECRQGAEETFTKYPALFDGLACFDDEGDLISYPTPQQKIVRLAEMFYQEGRQVYRPMDGTPRESVIIFPFGMDRFISYCEQQRNEQNETLYDLSELIQLPENIRLEIKKKLLAIHGDRLYQGRPSRDIYHELFSQCIRSLLFKAEDIERLFPVPTCEATQDSKQAAPRRRKEITLKEAAARCGVSGQTIKNWEAGRHTPEGWPGRESLAAFLVFSERYKTFKMLRADAREKNRAAVCGDLSQFSESADL
ncbi:MAG: helix-turn-helix transcriptional regulator [Desulfovibrio sp.]|nr:helix-turn-helix transcriptional regulator [Desulfovibrio sp.]